MDLFLKAIETSEDFQERMNIDSPATTQTSGIEPTLSFENRPPQWCIVEKPFSITVAINGDHKLGELEAVLFSNEGEVLEKLLQCQNSIDSTGKRILANIESNRASFNLKFIGGREGLVNIGILGKVNQTQKCMLKSPPIKV